METVWYESQAVDFLGHYLQEPTQIEGSRNIK
jgi:hypothetical protein